MHEYLTAGQVAERYGLATGTLANYRYLSTGPAFLKLPSGRIRYLASTIESWMNSAVAA